PAGTIPDTPGSYQFKDAEGRIIYVGKAKSLRSRLSNYFQDPRGLHPRTAQMVATAATVEWIQVRNEVEALMLEYTLIKRYKPRFNIRLVDDKSYPFLAVTLGDEWPRATVMRGRRNKGTRYFGPYAHAYAIRETLDELLRTFPIRTCSDGKLVRHQRLGRPCLLFHIEKCAAPCVGEITKEDYDQLVADFMGFLEGDTEPVLDALERQMREAASTQEFEQAARLRDRITSVKRAIERQQMVGDRSEDVDIIGIHEDEIEASAQIFFVRKGRVVGRQGLIVDKVMEMAPPQTVATILEQIYGDEPAVGYPKSVLVPVIPDDLDLYEEWLSEQRGSKVQIRIPQRGAKRELAETVTANAKEAFTRHRLRRASDHNSRAKALNELQDALDLPEAPLRIECYDMSHLQGTDYVGSMVVLEDGLPRKSEYRRFKVNVPGNNDFAAMEEVLTRRFSAYLAERERPIEERGKFSYPPELLLVDGGKGQLGVAVRVLEELGLDNDIPVASLAKQFEEVYVPDRSDPVIIPRNSEAMFMLQRIRDESHRFAITFHRERRAKRMTQSALDDIAGLGPKRRARLVKEFGSIKAIKAASREDLSNVKWLPEAVADTIWEKFHPREDQ
ncbi:MAG: excinuclease ABC subunit UvrC, partial [Microthrixaceae bacterium]|nr:excinuclease ABC subunit UvrC [Microthrixaceae bacterium]